MVDIIPPPSPGPFRVYRPQFVVTRIVNGKIKGYWISYGDFREEPSILRDFDGWFEWCLRKHRHD